MFETNQSIMLLGATGNTDVSVHLTNTQNEINSGQLIDSAESVMTN